MKTRIYHFVLVAMVASFIACNSTKKVMNSWLGDTKQNLILKWGPPARVVSDGGNGDILVYSQHVYQPNINVNYYTYKMFYANSDGKIYHWITRNEKVHPTQIDLNVYRRY